MTPELMRWLIGSGRLRERTVIAHEVPWLGRRIDIALMTARGVTSAFELKIGSLQRAIEQAAYNRSSFHRSWIVTTNRPKPEGLAWAMQLGIGIAVVTDGRLSVVSLAHLQSPPADVSRRVQAAIRAKRFEVQ